MYGPPEYFENRRLQATNDDSRKNNTSARSFTLRTRAQMETNATMIAERTSEPAPATLPVQSNESVPDASTSTAPPVVAEEHVKANVTHSSEPVKQFSKRYQIREGVKDIDTEFAKDLAYRRPTVYRGVTEILVKNLSALTDLSVLQQKYGDHMLDISILQNGESKPPFHTEQIAVKDFLSKIFSDEEFGSQHYLQQRDLKKDLPGLVENAGINPIGPHALSDLIPEEHCHFPTLYIGNKGIKTSLHYDRSCDAQSPDYQKNDPGKHNLFLQLSGSRRFTLFPMHLTEDLIPDEGSKWPHVSKSTTFLHTVLENCKEEDGIEKQIEYLQNSEYPSLARAWPEKIEIVLTPGEALLIPARWWHYTEILEGGLALNWWFRVDEGLEAKISAKLAESGEDAPHKEGKKCIIS